MNGKQVVKLLKKAGANPYRKTTIMGASQTVLELANNMGSSGIGWPVSSA